MSKDKISDYDSTAASNTEVGGINIEGNAPPSNFDNALREFASHLADMNAGTSPIDDTFTLADPADNTKRVRIDVGSVAAGQTRIITMPNQDITLGDGLELLDQDDMADNSATKVPSQQSVKAYVDSLSLELLDEDDFAGDSATKAPSQQSVKAYVLANASKPSPDVILADQKSSGTAGGTFTSGSFVTRVLNTVVTDPASLVTLVSNAFTFTSGGWIEWQCPSYNVNVTNTRLYNVTDSAVVEYGSNHYSGTGANSLGGSAVVSGKQYRIEHRCQTTKTGNGLGVNTSWGTETYTTAKFWSA